MYRCMTPLIRVGLTKALHKSWSSDISCWTDDEEDGEFGGAKVYV
jgi:hypothetical protein